MQSEILSKTIRDVAASVKYTGKLTIFNGAGISKAAGIPLAGEIVHIVADRLFSQAGRPAGDDLDTWLQRQPFYDHDKPYASLLDAAYPNRIERSKFFQSLITGKSSTKAHLAIAELMQKGIVNGVLTTNFDSLMEYAVVQVCNRVPCTILFNELPEFLRKDSLRPKVLKLHGDYLFGNIQNLERELSLVKNSMREKLRLYAYEETLVIAGYSGGDDSVMQVFEELAADPAAFPGGIYWLYLQNYPP
jgi:hypothetical protein